MTPPRPWIVAVAVALGGCRPSETTPATPTSAPAPAPAPAPALRSPDTVVADLERRLLDAERVHLVFEVESRGEVETRLRGVLVVGGDGRALLEAQGTFAGQVGVARVECDGTTLRGSSGTARLEVPCPNALGPALVLGLVRMGVLHNVARAWSAKPPDRAEAADGQATAMDAWVRTVAHRRVERPADAPGATDGSDAVGFDIEVDGQAVGDATLHLDGDGTPTLREQTVRFPGGDMRVLERYESMEIVPRTAAP